MLTYIKNLYAKIFGNDEPIPEGLTELDYIPLSEIKKNGKKPNSLSYYEKKVTNGIKNKKIKK